MTVSIRTFCIKFHYYECRDSLSVVLNAIVVSGAPVYSAVKLSVAFFIVECRGAISSTCF